MSALRTLVDSPIGPLTLVARDDVLVALRFGDHAAADEQAGGHPLLAEATRQLAAYFAGERLAFELPLAPQGDAFQLAVWREIAGIPYGSTTSYGAIARALGDVALSRRVGGATGQNPLAVIVPCHRVIGADGSLTGFGGGFALKQELLSLEMRVGAPAGLSTMLF
jgi:methylated-DNA-[protein]-cysteine S-methyltransferase